MREKEIKYYRYYTKKLLKQNLYGIKPSIDFHQPFLIGIESVIWRKCETRLYIVPNLRSLPIQYILEDRDWLSNKNYLQILSEATSFNDDETDYRKICYAAFNTKYTTISILGEVTQWITYEQYTIYKNRHYHCDEDENRIGEDKNMGRDNYYGKTNKGIKILKHGRNHRKKQTIECRECGCVFSFGENNAVILNNGREGYVECPECGKRVCFDFKIPTIENFNNNK